MPSLPNPFVPTFGTSPPLPAGRDGVIARLERALRHGPTHPDGRYKFHTIDTAPLRAAMARWLNEETNP